MRNAASCCQPRQESCVPRGARTTGATGSDASEVIGRRKIEVTVSDRVRQGRNVRARHAILHERLNTLADDGMGAADAYAGCERRAVVDALRGAEQLDGQDMLHVPND